MGLDCWKFQSQFPAGETITLSCPAFCNVPLFVLLYACQHHEQRWQSAYVYVLSCSLAIISGKHTHAQNIRDIA